MKQTAMYPPIHSRAEPTTPATSVPKADEAVIPRLLTPAEFALELKVSMSWLAKARMRGDGPPFIKIGRAVRYPVPGTREWIKAQSRTLTSDEGKQAYPARSQKKE
jgi:hypothetical protein